MSCQFTWNYDDYKINRYCSEEIVRWRATVDVYPSGIKNDAFDELKGHLVIESSETFVQENEIVQDNWNVMINNGNDVIGSLYIVTLTMQPASTTFKSQIKQIIGTVSCKGFLSKFNNGTAIIEFYNDTGRRCITLYEKN